MGPMIICRAIISGGMEGGYYVIEDQGERGGCWRVEGEESPEKWGR